MSKRDVRLYFGNIMKEKRIEKRYSQKQLADMLGTTKQSISNYEKGVYFPKEDMFSKLKKALDFNMDFNNGIPIRKSDKKITIEVDIDNYGMLLQVKRVILGKSQKGVGQEMGLQGHESISRYERGIDVPNINKRKQLAKILHFDFNIGEKLIVREDKFFSNVYVNNIDEQIDRLLNLKYNITKKENV